jgi:hypothetical protein
VYEVFPQILKSYFWENDTSRYYKPSQLEAIVNEIGEKDVLDMIYSAHKDLPLNIRYKEVALV